jgi:DNA-binding transcriptional ArsR family regulator
MNPPRVHTITDLAALRAVSDPLRTRILRELREEPRTTAQVAARLGEGTTKLHYHVSELERNGLVELVETRQKGNLIEKYYRAVAPFFRVDPRLFQEGPGALEAFYTSVTGMLDLAVVDLQEAIRAGEVTPVESGRAVRAVLHLRLAPEAVEEFRSRFAALVEELRERSEPEAGGGVALTLLFVPLAAAEAGAGSEETGGETAPPFNE